MKDEAGGFQGSARMAEPEDLVGAWAVTGAKSRCQIDFLIDRVESANAWRLSDRGACLGRLVPNAVGWRPAPDGIELAASDGRTLVMFDAAGNAGTTAGQPLRLARASN